MSINKMFMTITGAVLMIANIGAIGYARADDAEGNATAGAVKAEADKEIKEKAVLFKIHDVVPVKNNDGEVIGCDYSATFYNRSDFVIKGATIDFTWNDDAIADVIDQEKKEDVKKNGSSFGRANSVTERNTDKNVKALLEVPSIKPVRQVMVQSRVNSDRCFLLINTPKFSVKNCSTETPQGREEGGRECGDLFKYVSSDDPQYYLEFKAVTIDQEKEEEEAKRTKDRSETDELYKKTITALDSAVTILSGIK